MRYLLLALLALCLCLPAAHGQATNILTPFGPWMHAATEFGADPAGVADSTTAINYCLQHYSFCLLPPVPLGSSGYVCTSLSWGSNTTGVLWKLGPLGCSDPASSGNTWVWDWTSPNQTIWGSLSLPNVTQLSFQSYQACDSNGLNCITYTNTGPGAIASSVRAPSSSTGQAGGVASVSTLVGPITNSETKIMSASVANGTPKAGTTYRIKLSGTCTISTGATTATFNIRFGTGNSTSDAAIAAHALTTAATGSAVVFNAEYIVKFRSTSAADITGYLSNGATTGISTTVPNALSPATNVAVTTTAANFLGIYEVGGSANQSVNIQTGTIEIVTP